MFVATNQTKTNGTFADEVDIEEIDEFLGKHDLLEGCDNEDSRRRRYVRLSSTTFELVEESQWKYYYLNLL